MLKDILNSQQLEQLKTLIGESQNIIITCHQNADGDALGSCLGWAEYLKTQGKEPTIIVPDQYPDYLHWLPNTEKIVRYDKHREQADLLLKMVNLPSDVYNRTDDTVARITKKLDAIDRKLKPFFSIEAEHVMGRMMSHLRYLWKGYRLRSIEGYVRFGTDRPDLTGRICGLIYLILPARADRYLVDPQFYETVFRTDTDIRGVIRLYRLLVVAVRLLLDKEFRILIRKIRHR